MPPWMIEELEKARREREERERPRVSVELPAPPPGWVPEVPAWRREPELERGVYRIEF